MRFISRFGYRIIYFELDEIMFQVSLVIGIYLCVEYIWFCLDIVYI